MIRTAQLWWGSYLNRGWGSLPVCGSCGGRGLQFCPVAQCIDWRSSIAQRFNHLSQSLLCPIGRRISTPNTRVHMHLNPLPRPTRHQSIQLITKRGMHLCSNMFTAEIPLKQLGDPTRSILWLPFRMNKRELV